MSVIKSIMINEGFSAQPYFDTAGKLTIGYGRNLDDNPLTTDEAIYLLQNDVAKIEKKLMVYSWFNQSSESVRDVLLEMAYNIGISGLLQFKNMIAAIKNEDYNAAAAEMLNSKWAKQVGNRAVKLSEGMKNG